MKMSLSANGHRVTISYDDDGERVSRYFSVRNDGKVGYVHETVGNDQKQVCERLGHTGSTLMASAVSLPDVIRREYKAMRAADKRREARELA